MDIKYLFRLCGFACCVLGLSCFGLNAFLIAFVGVDNRRLNVGYGRILAGFGGFVKAYSQTLHARVRDMYIN